MTQGRLLEQVNCRHPRWQQPSLRFHKGKHKICSAFQTCKVSNTAFSILCSNYRSAAILAWRITSQYQNLSYRLHNTHRFHLSQQNASKPLTPRYSLILPSKQEEADGIFWASRAVVISKAKSFAVRTLNFITSLIQPTWYQNLYMAMANVNAFFPYARITFSKSGVCE